MRAPAHLGRGRPFLAEALDAPGVDELVHLLGPIGDLRVALAAMNDLDAELVGQVIELLRRGMVRNPLGLRAAEFLVGQRPLGDVQQRLLGEMADEPWVCAVLEHRGRPRLAPRRDHPPQVHVPPVERPLGRMLVLRSGVGIPELHGRVDVQARRGRGTTARSRTQSMFQARSISRSPAERCRPRSAPMFSAVTRSLTNVMPCSTQGFKARLVGIEVHDA